MLTATLMTESGHWATAGGESPPDGRWPLGAQLTMRLAFALAATLLIAVVRPDASAALPGRIAAADLIRLRSFGSGRIEAASPALDVATDHSGAFGFSASGCDAKGFSHRGIVHPHASLHTEVPRGARRVDVVLRSVHGERDLTLLMDGKTLAVRPLSGAWQRVSVSLPEDSAGERAFRLTVSGPRESETPLEEGLTPETRALLHAVIFSLSADPAPLAIGTPLVDGDAFWLEAGETAVIPAPLMLGQALETAAVRSRGDVSRQHVEVALVSANGGVETIAEIPASFTLPWNLDLSRRNERSPIFLSLTLRGHGDGAVGLVAPKLTVPEPATRPRAVKLPLTNRLAVIVVRGLRASDVARVGRPLPGAHQLPDTWTTATTMRPALASLLTGAYPSGLKVVSLRDRLDPEVPTLAKAAKRRGWRTVLRAGRTPLKAEDAVFGGFDEKAFAGPATFRADDGVVVDELAKELGSPGKRPIFALAVLEGVAPPYLVRSNAWKTYLPEGSDPPLWPPLGSRAVLNEVEEGKRSLDDKEKAYLRALRMSRTVETLDALRSFVEKAARFPNPTTVVIVGLAGEGEPALGETLSPELARAPVWVMGGDLGDAGNQTLDLTDLTRVIARAADLKAPLLTQAAELTVAAPHVWPAAAFTSDRGVAELVAHFDYALVAPRSGEARLFARSQRGRDPTTQTWDAPVGEQAANALPIRALLHRHARGFAAAGPSWFEATYAADVRRDDLTGYGAVCTD